VNAASLRHEIPDAPKNSDYRHHDRKDQKQFFPFCLIVLGCDLILDLIVGKRACLLSGGHFGWVCVGHYLAPDEVRVSR
jgi:hypothetical protein